MTNEKQRPVMLTVKEGVSYLEETYGIRISSRTLHRWVDSGVVAATRPCPTGAKWIKPCDLDELAKTEE
jgi:hypothetical protein